MNIICVQYGYIEPINSNNKNWQKYRKYWELSVIEQHCTFQRKFKIIIMVFSEHKH